ncbi:MAG: hypothetical protein ACO2ON_00625 [Candidatus Nanopusillus sp.]
MKKLQTVGLGIFFILVGIIIFVYWIILPYQYKQYLIQQLINETNITLYFPLNSSDTSTSNQYVFQNIQLSKGQNYYYIASNYTIGSYTPVYYINLGALNFETNIFYGTVSKSLYFYYSNDYNGVKITAYSTCNNGNFDIYVNNYKLYSGCQNGEINIFVSPNYLRNGDNELKISFSPNSIIFNGNGILNNINIEYLKLSSLNFNYYYVFGDVYMFYDFCPYFPQNVKLTINGLSISLSSCYSLLYLTPYLNVGENRISLISSYPVNVNNLYIESKSSMFYITFPNNLTNYILNIVVSQGSGEVIINSNCTYNINSSVGVYAINIYNCLLPVNVLGIRTGGYLKIDYLQIS